MIQEAQDDSLQRLRELSQELIGPDLMAAWLEDLPVPFLVVHGGANGPIVYFNAAAELLFGYTRGEVLGQPVEMLVPESVRPAHSRHRAAYEEDPRKRPMGMHLNLSARHKSGHEIPVEISLSPRMTVAGLMTSAVVWRKTRTETQMQGRIPQVNRATEGTQEHRQAQVPEMAETLPRPRRVEQP